MCWPRRCPYEREAASIAPAGLAESDVNPENGRVVRDNSASTSKSIEVIPRFATFGLNLELRHIHAVCRRWRDGRLPLLEALGMAGNICRRGSFGGAFAGVWPVVFATGRSALFMGQFCLRRHGLCG